MRRKILTKHKFDLSIAVFGVVLGITILLLDHTGQQFPTLSRYDIGARAVPDAIAILIIVLSIILVLQAWRRPQPSDDAETESLEILDESAADQAPPSGPSARYVLLMVVFFAAYLLAFWKIGFVVPTIVFLLLFYGYLGSRNWWKNVAIAVFFTLAVYYVFSQIFSVPLPASLLDSVIG